MPRYVLYHLLLKDLSHTIQLFLTFAFTKPVLGLKSVTHQC